jgi:catechol 2,3-dioxygenase-like lactoylglutathione lyase family enzyme
MNLNQVTVSVLNVENSILFYQKLGLTLIVKSLPNYARFLCKNGEATFSLHQSENKNSGNQTCIYFEVENLDEYVIELQTRGLSFDELPNDKPWLWRESRIKDLDGNQIILYYAGENRINPPWRIKE